MENKKIKYENNELFKVIGQTILCIILSFFFGYCGYTYSVDNNYNIANGIVFGALFPFILWTLHDLFDFGFIGYVLLIIIWIIICKYIPLFIGIVALILVIVYCIWKIINTYNNRIIIDNSTKYDNITKISPTYTPKFNNINFSNMKQEDANTELEEDEEEYYCERCNKRISEDEYIENCGLCEDCDSEVYFGERYDGDDYDLYR